MRAANPSAEKPAFRAAMKRRRCLIPADGFYEWQAAGERKQPFYVHAKSGAPLAFAGLWETWTGPNGEELDTAAIVTTEANRTLEPIHDRMPVIVPPEAFDLWLDCAMSMPRTAAALIAPAPEDLLEAYEVSTAVNRTANDNAKLVEPVPGDAAAPEPAPKPKLRQGRQARQARASSDQERQRAGSVDSSSAHSTLPGLRIPFGIEHVLQAAHQLERHRVLVVRQDVALHHADAVLGRDRAAEFLHHREHDVR